MSQLQSRRYIEEESAVNLNDILVKDAGIKREFLLFPVYKKLLIFLIKMEQDLLIFKVKL